jgi:hypothetical protein
VVFAPRPVSPSLLASALRDKKAAVAITFASKFQAMMLLNFFSSCVRMQDS